MYLIMANTIYFSYFIYWFGKNNCLLRSHVLTNILVFLLSFFYVFIFNNFMPNCSMQVFRGQLIMYRYYGVLPTFYVQVNLFQEMQRI